MRIEARGVAAGYGGRPVLHDISLHLESGEFVGLIGPNGSGKSTLLRVLSRTLAPQAGRVLLDGEPAARMSAREIARRIAFVPQSEPTLFEFSVREVVLMGRNPHVHGWSGETEADYAAAVRALASTDTLHLAERPITALSGGEHRRVLIARALAQSAPALLLDEPTAHLDMTHQAEILAIARRLADRESTAVLAALHDLNLAAEFCDRLVLLSNGRIAAEGAPESVMTAEKLSDTYGAPVTISRSPSSGKPLVFSALPEQPTDGSVARRIHVICGGGTGPAAFVALRRRGYVVTAGVLNQLDSDQESATALGIETATEAPYSRVGEAAREKARDLIQAADAVVVTDVPFGNGNLANLELAAEARAAGTPVYLLGQVPIESRDFTGGKATALWADIQRRGADSVPDVGALIAALKSRFVLSPDPDTVSKMPVV